MAKELRQYDPVQVIVSWETPIGGFDLADGTIDGAWLAAARDNPDWTREHDKLGNATRVRNHNTGGNVSITYSASSPANTALSGASATDRLTSNVVGILTIRDLNGDTLAVLGGAYINQTPMPNYGNVRGQNVWTWDFADAVVALGGHDLA